MRVVLLASICLALSCGGPRSGPGGGAAEARLDPAIELAARLPRGAHRCTVARPGVLGALSRSVYLPLSKGEPFAFVPDAPFVAVATAYRTTSRGRIRKLTLIRTSADRRTVRRFLSTRSGLRLSWPDEVDASDGGRRIRARFLDDATVALGGDFPESSRIGVEARCLSLASRHPDALEVAAWRGDGGLPGPMVGVFPERVDYHAYADERRLSMTFVSTLRSSGELSMLVPPPMEGPTFGLLPLRVLAESRDERVEGRRVIETTRVLWQDLMLAAEDERRIGAAMVRDDRSRGPRTVDEIDVSNLDRVHEQRMLWEALIEGSGPRGTRAREELQRLLERAIEAHPREAELRAQLFDLLARHRGDARGAERVAARAIADGVGDVATFRQLRREALARSDAARLADALRADEVVPRVEARDAAEALAAATSDGADYAFAEGAWIAGRALVRRSYRERARRVDATPLDLSALIEALGILVDVADVGGALWVAVEGQRPSWGIQRFSAEEAPRLPLDVGADVLIGAASTSGDARLGALARSMSDSLLPGPIVLSFLVVPFGGDVSRPVAWGRMEGDLADHALTVERIAGRGGAVDWRRVKRYLVDPLGPSQERVFPAPEISIEAASSSEADAIMALSDLHPFVICRRSRLVVTCRGAPDRQDVVHDFVVELASELLVSEATTLVGGR